VQQARFLLVEIGARDVCSAVGWELRSDLVFCILYFVFCAYQKRTNVRENPLVIVSGASVHKKWLFAFRWWSENDGNVYAKRALLKFSSAATRLDLCE